MVYTMNILVGHHGIFSLTPIWIMSLVGLAAVWRHPDRSVRWIAAITVGLTIICLAFYIRLPLTERNYGGVSSGFRWMFWFTPLWLILLLPAADRWLQSRWGTAAATLCLFVSVFSTHYNAMNPWSHPWIYQYWEYLGWIRP
jgi:hypothetical protein